MNSYFYRSPKLWNQLSIIDLFRTLNEIKLKLKKYFQNHFIANFDSNKNLVHFSTYVLVPAAPSLLLLVIIIICNILFCVFVYV